MFVYTVCFTLENKKPSENQYIELLIIWLTYAKKNAGLKKGDNLVVYVDTITFGYLNKLADFANSIYGDSPEYNISFQSFNQPKTLSEGMTHRYSIFQKKIPNDIYIYLDVDCLILRSMHDYQNLYKRDDEGVYLDVNGKIFRNTLCVMPEGVLSHTNYCGDIIEITPYLKDACGYSSGHFIFTQSNTLKELFQRIISSVMLRENNPMYTLDQPFLNYEIIQIYKHVNYEEFAIVQLDQQKMEANVLGKTVKNAYLLNFCGEPGDGKKHFLKALFYLCKEYIHTK